MLSYRYRRRPSEIIGIPDEYTAFCFDEACEMIARLLEDKDVAEPVWSEDEAKNKEHPRSELATAQGAVLGKKGDLISFLKGFAR